MADRMDQKPRREGTTERAAASCPPPSNTRTRKGARLPARAKLKDGKGEQIGRLRSGVWYDMYGYEVGTFRKEGEEFRVRTSKYGDCRLDKNDNIFAANNAYVASFRRLFGYPTIVYIAAAAIVLLLAAFFTLLGFYLTRPQEAPLKQSYVPTLFLAEEDGTEWDLTKDLPIFLNEQFGDSIIAPGMKGSYRFRFENANDDALVYALSFTEVNPYGIELCYRLKRDGAYVVGNAAEESYCRPDALGVEGLTIEASSTTMFELEWFWRHNDSVDTAAGENGASYTFTITLTAGVKE